jgi:hypothetical protein
MEDIVNSPEGVIDAIVFSHVADVEFGLIVPDSKSHVFLFLFITTKHTDLGDIRV